jgi:phage terminase large subunit
MPLFVTQEKRKHAKGIRSYKWKVDKDGKVLDEPVKFMDHAMDAIRYAVFTKFR